MNALNNTVESCLAAEAKISRAQELLAADARPETVERCVAELGEAAELLRGLAGGEGKIDPEASVPLRRIQSAAGRLNLQIEHASRLCLGWIQRRLGTGYTAQGAPVLMPQEAETLFEA